MSRERISLVPDEVKHDLTIRQQILTGEMTPEKFATLSEAEKAQINEILFKIASEKVEPNVGVSVLEFILFGFMRIMVKKMSGETLTEEDQEIEASIDRIMTGHEITNGVTPKANWLFDYMMYAEYNATKLLENRLEHINRKKTTIGVV
jgi:hypothetical protein